MSNVYYDSEKLGLEELAKIDYSDGEYCFDYRVIWRHKESGKLLTARDSGYSCPEPFEDYTSIEMLETFNAEALIREARSEKLEKYHVGDGIEEFVSEIKAIERQHIAENHKPSAAERNE